MDEDDILYLGCLNIPITTYNVITERKLGKINMGRKLQSVIVELYLKEGWEVPHLHVYNDKFKTAIRLDKAEYFNHGKYDGKFNNDQAKIFNDFMKEHDKYINVTRWEIAAGTFNTEFPDHPIKISKQPDYSKLNEK